LKLKDELVNCPNCGSQYRVVRVEVDPAVSYGRIECRRCGGPLNSREGKFILKYFLVDGPRKRLKPPRVE
jgi:transcription elongation factor Elf1